ncbi:MAG TPA: acyl-CoA synthetase [Polyangiaceae bacterium]|nr:acyl-CoA synthetase [Polyangiaceae bacterium]
MEFNIADMFESVADAVPDRAAVVCGDRRLTFAELDERATRAANALLAQGVRPGDHLGLYLYNGTEFLELMLAAFKIRAVPININYRYVEEELAFLLSNAKVVAVAYEAELAPRMMAVRDRIESLRTCIVVGAGREAPKEPRVFAYDAFLASASTERRFDKRSGSDIYIIYTGGTTGMPRGVMWRHEDVFFAGLQGGNPGGPPIERAEELASNARERTEPLTFLPAAPFIHGAAQWAALIGLFGGGKIALVPGRSFNAKALCKLIETEKVNTVMLVGDAMVRPIVEALAEPGASYDLSSLIVISSAGALLSDTVKGALCQHLPEIMIIDSFGATEAGHQGSSFPTTEGEPRRPKFMMDDTSTVFDEQMRPVEPGSGVIGRLARRGRIPLGYYNDPEKTAATFITVDGVRWVLPGDLATIESDGLITVFGRGAVCINSGGEKIFPEEVEAALKAHSDVIDAVVVGVPDERWGQRVAAIVQARAGTQLTLELLEAHCRTRIAGYKVPRQLKVVDEIARQPSGKPDYRWAAAVASGAAPGASATPPEQGGSR